jgi:uncharacterized membrane protein YheB (UPF0754 family)
VEAILADVRAHFWTYLSMPFIAALIGYVTKLVAIRMMFQPIEWVGVGPFGWQGIVPRKAARMASIAVETMTTKLISSQEIFGRLDPERVAKELEKPLLKNVDQITREVMGQHQPGLWESLPPGVQDRIIKRIQAEAPRVVAELMADVRVNIDRLFDLKHMVVMNLMRDKKLLNEMIMKAGHKEFRFIAHSGIYFGFIIGCVQAVTWALTHSTWVMPLFGGFTGWFTDWLALRMIFEPKEPKRYFFGLVAWQGLFLKRRKEVAADYGRLVASEILTPRNLVEGVLRGPLSDRLFAYVARQVKQQVDAQVGIARPFVTLAVGSKRYQEMKDAVADKLVATLPDTLRAVESYATDALDINNTVVSKMQEMSPEDFEGLLRPAFKQDEWILITVGAVLGFLVGELQVFLMVH